MKQFLTVLTLAPLIGLMAPTATAETEDNVLNLYSARHYQTDEALYSDFTRQTGITIHRIEGNADELLERIKNEGANSKADVLLTVDAARLDKAEKLGLFEPVSSKVLEERLPHTLRAKYWHAFSTRARVIIFNNKTLKASDIQSYEDMADPKFKGKICSRSGGHPYNLSLVASMIAHRGEENVTQWAKAVVSNLAHAPRGGDTDQIKAVSAGECEVAVSNTYYLARLMRSDKPEDKQVMANIGIVWPNQSSTGTHINISGGGMLKHAPHKKAAVKFLEYLASETAQRHFANGNNEWPAVPSVAINNPALDAMGTFKPDTLPISDVAKHQASAQKILDRVGFR